MTSSTIKATYLALLTLFSTSLVEANGKSNILTGNGLDQGAVVENSNRHLDTDDRLRDLLGHPAFSGFARLLLPWNDRHYDPEIRLRDIAKLLPYHSHVDPETVVGALNRMIDDVNSGHAVFYPFYSEERRREQSALQNTGLFFFRGKPDAPFAVIAPGGGFSYVGSVHEGFPYAAEISARGYNAFVLRYRTGHGGTVATEDLAAAISYIFLHANTLAVSTGDYSLWGSSAGARMAATIGSHGVGTEDGDALPGPSIVVMAYTGHSDYSSAEPPTFVVVGEQDAIAPPSSMERRIAALRSGGVEVEYHKYGNLGHGFGPGIGTSAEGWIGNAIRFWEKFINHRN